MKRLFFSALSLCVICQSVPADDGLLGGDENVTATGDVLDATGELARGLGKGALLQSMSAEQLQEAIGKALENREEGLEQYYELRELRKQEMMNDSPSMDSVRKVASSRAPERLGDHQINRETGDLYWPSPLDDEALKPYRKPIEETFAVRSSPGHEYRRIDYVKVSRMVGLIREAVDSIADQLDSKEVGALNDYLTQIDYDARFNGANERVDY